MITPAYFTKIDENHIGISTLNTPGSKVIHMAKTRVEYLLGIDSYEDLNKELMENYKFLFMND